MLTYTIWPLTTSLIASFSFLAHFFYPSHTDFRILPQGCQEHGQLGPLILFLLPGYLFSHMPTRPTNPLCWWMFSFHFSKKLSFLLATSPEYREALANAIHLKNKKQANKQQQTGGIKREKNPHLLTTYCITADHTVPEKNALSHLIPKQHWKLSSISLWRVSWDSEIL